MEYTTLVRRIIATQIDGIAIVLWAFLCIGLVTTSVDLPLIEESVIIIVLVVSFEPFCVSFTGSSVGQHFRNLKVCSSKSLSRIGLVRSYIRFIVKLPLGIISLFTVLTTRRYQAVHDLLCRTVVTYKKPEAVPINQRLLERIYDHEEYKYAHVVKRLAVIFFYTFLTIVLCALLMGVIVEVCSNQSCMYMDFTLVFILTLIIYISPLVITYYGWHGFLFGARKKKRVA